MRVTSAGTAGTRPRSDTAVSTAAVPTLTIAIFIISLLAPVFFFIGPLRLSPDRLVLLILFLPMLVKFISGQAGRIQACDILIILFSFWMIITLVIHHGLERLPYAIISVVELLGGYLTGRVLIRSAAAYKTFLKFFLLTILFLLPIGLIELFTNYNVLQQIFGSFLPHYVKGGSSYGRMGMERVMAGFAHPILFGLFCSLALASATAVFGTSPFRWIGITVFVIGMTFMSLSSGPLIAVVLQIGLLLWGKVTGGKWWTLAILTAIAYVVVDILSNRTPITIAIEYITFNPVSAWTRVNIYTFGIKEVWDSPVIGIGLNDWRRPFWLTGSIDNFWLLNAVRHGIPGFLLIAIAFFTLARMIWKAEIPSAKLRRWRTGYMIVLIGLIMTLATVHIWSEVAVFVFFFLGAGVWFANVATQKTDDEALPPDNASRDRSRYVRL